MSAARGPATDRVQQLLSVVEQARDKRCAEIMDHAQAEARELLRHAWQKARVRLHHEVQQSRQQFHRHLVLEQAGNEARVRQARQSADRLLLEQAWQPLRDALIRRWQVSAGRRAWVDAVVDQALGRLVGKDWRIEHPSEWPEQERQAVEERLHGLLGTEPLWVVEPSLPAGIRIRAGDTFVDGSCDGLLRDRNDIEARLLAFVGEASGRG
jgi:vacuolar-type H+-ATPase subunit H